MSQNGALVDVELGEQDVVTERHGMEVYSRLGQVMDSRILASLFLTFKSEIGQDLSLSLALADASRMPAPAAPRKKGTLTATTTTTSRTTRTKAASSDEAELTRKLERVTLGESRTVAPAKNAVASTTRTTAKTSATKQPVSAAPATPLQQIAAASAKVNNILKSFGGARQGPSNSLKALYSDASSALDVLRIHRESVEPKKRMEIEKAALVLVGHCLDNGLVS